MITITLLVLGIDFGQRPIDAKGETAIVSLWFDSSRGLTTWSERLTKSKSEDYFVCRKEESGVSRRKVPLPPFFVRADGSYLTIERGSNEHQRCSLFSQKDLLIGSVSAYHGVAYSRGSWVFSLQGLSGALSIARTEFLPSEATKTSVVTRAIDESENASCIGSSLDGRVVAWWNERHADRVSWLRNGKIRTFDHDWPIESCAVSRSGSAIYVLVRNEEDRVIAIDTETGKEIATKSFRENSIPKLWEDDGSEGVLVPGARDEGLAGLYSRSLEFVSTLDLDRMVNARTPVPKR